ncbi:MAG: isopentenyl phosphate kinase family protein [Methanobacteriota archaeon]|nr:MAG: isopentenyl phosphate kinase family protein [Euryarchaeota archaeon]
MNDARLSPPRRARLVKLGGSVITDKGSLRTFREEACRRLASELRASTGVLVVVHGAGSFGHIVAKEHRLHEGYRDDGQLEHVARVQRDVRELSVRVIGALIDSGIRAVSVPPASAATFKGGAVKEFDPSPFDDVMGMQLTPVTFGDVVPDESMRFSICSGDLLMLELARHLKPELVVFCADVDGVFTGDPKTDEGATLVPRLGREALTELRKGDSLNADVTGGMLGKLGRMLDIASHCEKCMILNGDVPGRLEGALRGDDVPSTTVVPG